MNNADEQQDRPTLLAQWLLTLYPLASLYQWSRVGVVLLTVGSMLQVTFAIGSMVLIASLADSTASGDLTRPLTGIVLLILCSQLLDAVSAACNRVVAADVERFNEEKVVQLAVGHMSQLEFEQPHNHDFFNAVRGREMGGLMARQFVLAALEVFSLRLTGLVALLATASIAWYLPLLILPALAAIRLWLQAETRILGDSFRKSSAGLRRAGYFRRLLLDKAAVRELALFDKRRYVRNLFVNTWLETMEPVWQARKGRRAKVLLVGCVVALSVGGALGLQALRALSGPVTATQMLLLAQLIPACMPMAFAGHGEIIIAQGSAMLRRLAGYKLPAAVAQPDADTLVPLQFAHVTLSNVHFRYPGAAADTLQGIDLRIGRGESIGIVGTNGAGKSTLIKVLTGLFEPTSGALSTDAGVVLDTADPRWKHVIDYVPQKSGRLPGTVMQLVSRFDPQPDAKAVHEALKQVGADKFVYALPQGLQTHIGDHGFSGGQEQLIALAQAFYRKDGGQRIRVFDEPTAALSGAREMAIFDLLLGARDKDAQDSLILVSHRLGGLRKVDRIVVIDAGRVVETGTHDALMRKPGSSYRRMYEQQSEPYLQPALALLQNAG